MEDGYIYMLGILYPLRRSLRTNQCLSNGPPDGSSEGSTCCCVTCAVGYNVVVDVTTRPDQRH